MNAIEQAIDWLALQEMESLAACIARGQEPSSYTDIVEKLRGHCLNLPDHRRQFWIEQCKALGVELFPVVKPRKAKDSGGTSVP